MSYDHIREKLDDGGIIIIDGATGSGIESRGGPLVAGSWSTMANVDAPEIVRAVHDSYIQAGSNLIIANTFAASRRRLRSTGLDDRVIEINQAAVRIAREAADAAERPIAVAGSISSISIGCGAGDASTPSDAYEAHREQALVLAEAGVDCIALEMIKEVDFANADLRAARETGLPVWAGFSCKAGDDGAIRLLRDKPGRTFEQALRELDLSGVHVATVMHTEVEVVTPSLAVLTEAWPGPFGAYPHAGRFEPPHWRGGERCTPEVLRDAALEWRGMGAQVFGACCGLGAEHIRALAKALA